MQPPSLRKRKRTQGRRQRNDAKHRADSADVADKHPWRNRRRRARRRGPCLDEVGEEISTGYTAIDPEQLGLDAEGCEVMGEAGLGEGLNRRAVKQKSNRPAVDSSEHRRASCGGAGWIDKSDALPA